MDTKTPKVIVIVLIYNGMKWLEPFFGSMLKTDYRNFEVVALDNHSSDQSVEEIKKRFPQVKIIQNDKNYGTAEGTNIGFRYALKEGSPYVAIFNQDIKVTPDWLKNLMTIAESDPTIGMLSPVQFNYTETEIDSEFQDILKRAGYYEDFKNKTLKNVYFTNFVVGASVLIKREALLKVGLNDPFFFMYYDDKDLCRRFVYRGFKIGCVMDSVVFHKHSMETDQSKVPFKLKYLHLRNYLIYVLKNPTKSFFYNLKDVFIWTNWREPAKRFGFTSKTVFKIFLVIFLNIPSIYWKYWHEKTHASYL